MKTKKVGHKKQQTVIRSLETDSWDVWDRGETKRIHERRVNNLIRKFEMRGYSATSAQTTESRQRWHCYDGGTTGVDVFETDFVFNKVRR